MYVSTIFLQHFCQIMHFNVSQTQCGKFMFLCEINFAECTSSKNAIFAIIGALNFGFGTF